MESIFDYNPTDEEWRALFGQCPADDPEFFAEVEQDVKDAGGSPLSTLIRLFILRGETKKAREYLARIEDPLEHYEASTFFQHMS